MELSRSTTRDLLATFATSDTRSQRMQRDALVDVKPPYGLDPARGAISPVDDASVDGLGNAARSIPRGDRLRRDETVLISIIAIAIGAAFGAVLRWYLANRLNAVFPRLPPGTLAANLLGAYLIGIALAVFLAVPTLSPLWRLLIVTGFLGGLTTFSTFSAEVVTALLEARWGWALATIAVHVSGSIGLTVLGFATVRGVVAVVR